MRNDSISVIIESNAFLGRPADYDCLAPSCKSKWWCTCMLAKNKFATELLFCCLKCLCIDCSEMEKKQLPEMPVKWLRNLKCEREKNKSIWIEKKLSSFCFLKMKSAVIWSSSSMMVISVGNWHPLCLGHILCQKSEDQPHYSYVYL